VFVTASYFHTSVAHNVELAIDIRLRLRLTKTSITNFITKVKSSIVQDPALVLYTLLGEKLHLCEQVFVTGKNLWPSLKLEGKAGTYHWVTLLTKRTKCSLCYKHASLM